MDQNKTCLEMAFDLARSGKFTDLALLERRLHSEGYSTSQLDGPSLRRQMRALLAEAGKTKVSATQPADGSKGHPLPIRTQKEQPTPKPASEDAPPAIDVEEDLGTRPAEPVETDSNDIPTADANGDSDDERADENQAVPDRS